MTAWGPEQTPGRPLLSASVDYLQPAGFWRAKVDQVSCEANLRGFEYKHPRVLPFFRACSGEDNKLLFMQIPDQERMLWLYGGSDEIGVDATYKLSKWIFPPFLLNVVDNNGKGYPGVELKDHVWVRQLHGGQVGCRAERHEHYV